MKKIFTILNLIILIALAGCNRSSSPENTITFWHFWSEPNQKQVLDSLIKVFEKENHCTVKLTELSWNDGKTKLMAAFNSNTAPDILELGSDWVAQFSSAGVLKELRRDSMNFDKFVEFSKSPAIWNNKLYCLPWVVDTRVLFVNKDLLKKAGLPDSPPESFNQILSDAPAINSLSDIYAFGINGSDAHRLYKKIVTFFWSNGGEIFDSLGNPTLNSPQNANGLGFYVQLSKNGFLETQRQIDAAFTQGKIAYWISGGWLLEKIKNENPSLNFEVAVIPNLNGHKGISFAGGEYLAINKKTDKSKLAAKFIKFMTDGKNSIEFCKKVTEAGFPADKNYFQNEFYNNIPTRKVFARQLEFAKMTPVHPKWLEIEEILEDASVRALYGEQTPQEALNLAQDKVLLLLKK